MEFFLAYNIRFNKLTMEKLIAILIARVQATWQRLNYKVINFSTFFEMFWNEMTTVHTQMRKI